MEHLTSSVVEVRLTSTIHARPKHHQVTTNHHTKQGSTIYKENNNPRGFTVRVEGNKEVEKGNGKEEGETGKKTLAAKKEGTSWKGRKVCVGKGRSIQKVPAEKGSETNEWLRAQEGLSLIWLG